MLFYYRVESKLNLQAQISAIECAGERGMKLNVQELLQSTKRKMETGCAGTDL
jgi:hypothetical protein